jgi:hypothetical protein
MTPQDDHNSGKAMVVGKPDVHTASPTHVAGIREGNAEGNYKKAVGHLRDGKSKAARSTGINPDKRDPIDPSAPNLSPA